MFTIYYKEGSYLAYFSEGTYYLLDTIKNIEKSYPTFESLLAAKIVDKSIEEIIGHILYEGLSIHN